MVISARMSFSAVALAATLFTASAMPGFAGTETKTFNQPQYKSHLLDWCLTWATDCGKPAADKFCQNNGYDGASAYPKWNNPGQSTRLIGSNQVCDEPECDGFTSIQCTKTVADGGGSGGSGDEVTFLKPKYKGKRLDWCKSWATDCGEAAADAFCEYKGYDGATDFVEAVDIGNTKVISSGQVCADQACDGFKKISCQ
jgi:hypothetical protein